MRYMGWSWADYRDCPAEIVDDIVTQMTAEQETFGAPVSYVYALHPHTP
jgi:hypothetical protein